MKSWTGKLHTISLVLFFNVFLCSAGGAENRIKTTHFDIVHDGVSKRYAEIAARSAERSLSSITEILGHQPRESITIMIARDEKHFAELTEGNIPDWGAAAALPGNRIVISPLSGYKKSLEHILAHEIVHCVINDAAGERFVPRWFHEGCAQYFSGEWGVRNRVYIFWKTIRGKLLTFGEIQNVFSSGSTDASLSYDQSMLAIQRLIYKNGRNVLPTVIGGMKNGNDFARSFWEATGLWPSEFERDYLIHVSQVYGKRSLYLLIPSTWTLILILAIVIYVIKRRHNKRLIQQWEIVEAAENIINFEDIDREY